MYQYNKCEGEEEEGMNPAAGMRACGQSIQGQTVCGLEGVFDWYSDRNALYTVTGCAAIFGI